MTIRHESAVFGGGCFWCTEAVFQMLRGVVSVKPGYSGGVKPNPTYEEVCGGNTGYVEVIRLEFNPEEISFIDLLSVFFATHDPTTMNRQGADTGEQYASVIFYMNDMQRKEAGEYIEELKRDGIFERPIVTRVVSFSSFYEAEDYHKNYYQRNSNKPYCELVIAPKIQKLYERFEKLLKK